jgi:hypothetical protein
MIFYRGAMDWIPDSDKPLGICQDRSLMEWDLKSGRTAFIGVFAIVPVVLLLFRTVTFGGVTPVAIGSRLTSGL